MKNAPWSLLAACLLISLFGGALAGWSRDTFFTTTHTVSTGIIMSQGASTHEIQETSVSSDVVSMVERASPSVVSIIVTKELLRYKSNPRDFAELDPFFGEFFGGPLLPERGNQGSTKQKVAGGTGFIVTADGKVVTNKHVVQDAEAEYTVVMGDGTEYAAEVISRDPSNDLAVLQMKAKEGESLQNLRSLKLARSSDVRVGQTVVAIGNALGEFNNSVTVGVVSAKGRSIAASDGGLRGSLEQLSNLIQTDAAINPGNSGGPLLALDGSVVGINTAVAQSANGIGFAIPASDVDFVLRSVAKYGKIIRPYLGVIYRTNSPQIAKQFGLDVDYGAILEDSIQDGERAVITGGPADTAGLQSGDIILTLNGTKITKESDLKDLVGNFLPEDEVTITVLRGKETLTKSVKLGKREDTTVTTPTVEGTKEGNAYFGVYSTPITPELQKRLQLPVSEGALIYNDFSAGVPAVVQGSPAAKAGLRAGDIILSFGGEKITALRTLSAILASKKPGDTLEVVYRRDGKEEKITVTLEARQNTQEQE